MKQFNLTILITMLLGMFGAKAFAYDIAAANADGVTIYYTYINDSTELEVSYNYANGSLAIPESVTHDGKTYRVTSIGKSAFADCAYLTSVTIPNSVTKIGSSAFYGCKSLTSVTIPNSVKEIGGYAFYWNGLTSVTIGNSVAEIGPGAFLGCTALTTLYSLNTTPPSIALDDNFTDNWFTDDQYTSLNVFVPQEALEAYQNAERWKDFKNLQGDPTLGVEKINTKSNAEAVYYDLRGNRLNAPKRGLNIINGKKVMME